ncbi:hypothetical protein HPB50_023487 [Hyalomma asiaticum]|uniref:Uncharacterized protein n=1 Tax=Hyalomma asiaticum TaxID=266040 RepID=A0ACB7S8U4_HYAAI|nr:hypothetical protein HPB50_023487 [Hyalomma asiaticum]
MLCQPSSNLLRENDGVQRVKLMELICVRFLQPLLVNYAFNVSDKHDAFKYFPEKPLSRKYVTMGNLDQYRQSPGLAVPCLQHLGCIRTCQ